MKYFFKVLVVLVLAAGVVFGAYYYTNGNPFEKKQTEMTTVTKPAATEKNASRVLLAALEKDDYYLYKATKGVILTHAGKEYEFENWSRLIDAKTPEMYLGNFDKDKDKELVIKAVSSKNESSGEYVWDLYILNPKKDADGNDDFDVILASKTTWGTILDKDITEQVTQLKKCKKICQLAMNAANKSITYDDETGIASGGYVGFFRALQNSNAAYLTVESWEKGSGQYSIKNGKICVEVDVNIKYKDSSTVQKAGVIYFELSINDKNVLYVTEKSMVFTANEKYRVSNPSTVSSENWSYTENNENQSTDYSSKVIRWIKYTTHYNADTIEDTQDFSTEQNDIRAVSKIYVKDNYIEITAKSGFTFDTQSQKSGEYSVIINKGTDDEYDISYTSSIMKINGADVLKITFDKSYPQNEIKTIDINYGAK